MTTSSEKGMVWYLELVPDSAIRMLVILADGSACCTSEIHTSKDPLAFNDGVAKNQQKKGFHMTPRLKC